MNSLNVKIIEKSCLSTYELASKDTPPITSTLQRNRFPKCVHCSCLYTKMNSLFATVLSFKKEHQELLEETQILIMNFSFILELVSSNIESKVQSTLEEWNKQTSKLLQKQREKMQGKLKHLIERHQKQINELQDTIKNFNIGPYWSTSVYKQSPLTPRTKTSVKGNLMNSIKTEGNEAKSKMKNKNRQNDSTQKQISIGILKHRLQQLKIKLELDH